MLAKWTMTVKGVTRLFGVLVVITILSDISGVQAVRIGGPPQKLRLKGKIMRATKPLHHFNKVFSGFNLRIQAQEFGYAKNFLNFEM